MAEIREGSSDHVSWGPLLMDHRLFLSRIITLEVPGDFDKDFNRVPRGN